MRKFEIINKNIKIMSLFLFVYSMYLGPIRRELTFSTNHCLVSIWSPCGYNDKSFADNYSKGKWFFSKLVEVLLGWRVLGGKGKKYIIWRWRKKYSISRRISLKYIVNSNILISMANMHSLSSGSVYTHTHKKESL